MRQQKKTTQYDKMTGTPIPRLVLTLSAPAVISMLVTNIYNLVDTAFVGRLGTSASGAVGIVFGFMSVLQAFGFLFGQGAGSILSRALGEKDTEKASQYASAGVLCSFLCGAVISVLGFFFLDPIVRMLGSTDTIAPYAKTYISFILASAPFMCSSLTMNNILRYEGKAALGMIGLMTGAVLNMAGDPVFMFALKMEIAGAGLSTALSQLVSWGILLWMFLSHKTQSKIGFIPAAQCGIRGILDMIATGFPSLLRQGLNSLTTVMLNSQCAVYGDAAIAAMSIVSRIVFFAFSVALGVGQGFQPVSAFNYGAKKYDRLKKEVIEIGTRALRLQAFSMLLLPPCMTTEMLFQSTGKRLGAAFLSALRSGLLFIPLLLILAHFRGLAGIQESYPLSLALSLPLTIPFAVWFFKKLPEGIADEDDKNEQTPTES